MKTWKKLPDDYEIRCWDESNFDIKKSNRYVRESYENKKYAFVSDYVRLWALYEYGGVYMDTDMEVYRSFDHLLEKAQLVCCFEHETLVSAGFIATTPYNPIIKEMLDSYAQRSLIKEDGTMDTTPINFKWNEILRKHGVIPNGKEQVTNSSIFVGSYTYFNSVSMKTWHAEYTDTTYTVHHYAGSWQNSSQRQKCILKMKNLLQVVIGFKNYAFLQKITENRGNDEKDRE